MSRHHAAIATIVLLCAGPVAAATALAQSIECGVLGGRECGGGLNLTFGFQESDGGSSRPPLITTEPNPRYQGLIRGTPDLDRREPYYGGPFRDPGALTPETDFRINFQ